MELLGNIDKKKLKDYLFKAGIVLVFIGLMYFIFHEDDSANAKNKTAGLNTELPDGKADELKDKLKAYENSLTEEAGEQRMKSLNDYMFSLRSGEGKQEIDGDKYDLKIRETTDGIITEENEGVEKIKSVIHSGNDMQVSDAEYNRLASEKAGLETQVYKLEKELQRRRSSEEQMEMVEKSLKLAAKYTGNNPAVKTPRDLVDTDSEPDSNSDAIEVSRPDKDVVTTLSEELLLDAPYNYGFNTAVGSGYTPGTNTIRAAISEEQTVTAGQRVKLRLLEPLQAGTVTIPRNHLIAGITTLSGDRMDIKIESIEYAGNIIPVRMKVYDTDGMAGIYCPGSAELDALKEGAANIGAGLGSSITFTRSAGQQIASDVTRGVMTGGSQYLSKKLRTVKVTLRSNYEVLLLPQKK